MHGPTVLEVRNLKSVVRRARVPTEALGKSHSCLILASIAKVASIAGVSQLAASVPPSLFLLLHGILPWRPHVSICVLFLLLKTTVIWD